MSLATDIYGALYDLAMACHNPGYGPETDGDIPPVPVIQNQQDQDAPTTGVYLSISGSPQLERIGTPDFGGQGSTDARSLDQLYQGTVTIWEVNGDGSKIQELFDYSWTESGQAILDTTAVSILDYGEIVDASFKAESRWISQSRTTLLVSIKARVSETLPTASTIQWADANNPEIIHSVEYPNN